MSAGAGKTCPNRLALEVATQRDEQAANELLVPQPRGRGHQQLPAHNLVPVAVVGERADLVRREINRCGHTHRMGSSAPSWQERGTAHDGAAP